MSLEWSNDVMVKVNFCVFLWFLWRLLYFWKMFEIDGSVNDDEIVFLLMRGGLGRFS